MTNDEFNFKKHDRPKIAPEWMSESSDSFLCVSLSFSITERLWMKHVVSCRAFLLNLPWFFFLSIFLFLILQIFFLSIFNYFPSFFLSVLFFFFIKSLFICFLHLLFFFYFQFRNFYPHTKMHTHSSTTQNDIMFWLNTRLSTNLMTTTDRF